MRIPLSSPDIGQAEIDAVVGVLRSGRLSLGEKLEEFESRFASYTGVPCAAAVSSGTAALHLAVRALGIGEGDEVILPSFAFIACLNALRYERVSPVFADIDPRTLNLDPGASRKPSPRARARSWLCILLGSQRGCTKSCRSPATEDSSWSRTPVKL